MINMLYVIPTSIYTILLYSSLTAVGSGMGGGALNRERERLRHGGERGKGHWWIVEFLNKRILGILVLVLS
jgi:hypothetical protein